MIRLCLLMGAGSVLVSLHLSSCHPGKGQEVEATQGRESVAIKPRFKSDTVLNDTDDPAIWINRQDPSQSLIIGTDKGGDASTGGLYVFTLQGKIIPEKTITLKRPNNVDVGYGLTVNGMPMDIAVCTERNTNSIRVFSLPDMKAIDNSGIAVFEGDSLRAPMGIALYKTNKKMYAIVGRKNGHNGTYLWQYELVDHGGIVKGKLVRKFGEYSGKNEIESIAVDNELGYVYYSDEGVGVRKYYAHPDSSSIQLALFAEDGFVQDHEGISIYKKTPTTGYILVSDQQANQFHVFSREGSKSNPHDHQTIGVLNMSTTESDGSDVTSESLPDFTTGLFVAMSDDKTFQFYNWSDIMENLEQQKAK